MEHNPSNVTSFEAPNAGPDKPDDKPEKSSKKKSVESVTANHRKVERDIARSLFELPNGDVNERQGLFSKPEVTPPTPVENLTTPEAKYVQQAIAQEHLNDMRQAEPLAAVDLEPATNFLERVAEDGDTETAFAEIATELGMDEAAITEALEASGEDDGSEDFEADAEPESFEDDDTNNEWAANEDALSPPVAGGCEHRGGGNSPPIGGNGGLPPTPGPNPGGQPVPNRGPRSVPNTNSVANLNALPPAANSYYYARYNRGDTIIAGATGYLLGRRRGRIKTQKKLLPLQHKLERRVTSLERSITQKEQLLVRAKAEQRQSIPPTNAERVQAPRRAEAPRVAAQERTQPGRRETRIGLQKPERAERLGHMAVEAPEPQIVERIKTAQPNNIREAFRPEHVKDMQRSQLLELSEKIVVEGASLRRIYESHLIGEKQLRHLVTEYLSGKDIRKDLRREMVEREIDFERDPILRDRVRSRLSSADSGGGLNELLAQAGALPLDDDRYDKRQASADERAKISQQKAQRQRQTADTAMITAIVVLAVVILVLVLKR